MLTLFLAITADGVISGALSDLEHDSCTVSMAVAVVALIFFFVFRQRLAQTAKPMTCSPVKTGVVLTLACFLVNLIWILIFRLKPYCDYETFNNIATALSQGPLLGAAAFDPALRIYVALFPHLFGYSFFLSLFMRIFGQSWLLAPMLNLVLTTCSGIMIYVLCLRWLDQRRAVYAFLLWIICPSKMLYNTMVLSEPLYTTLLLLFLVFLSRTEMMSRGARRPILSGLLLGAAGGVLLFIYNAVRPVASIMIIALLIWILLLRGEELKNPRSRKLWLAFMPVLLVVFALLGSVNDSFVEKKIGEEPAAFPVINIYVGFNTDSQGSYSQEDVDVLLSYIYREQHPAKEAQELLLDDLRDRLKSGDIDFPSLFQTKLGKFLGSDEGGAYYSGQTGEMTYTTQLAASVLSNVFYYFVVGLALYSVIGLVRRPVYSTELMLPLLILGFSLAQLLVEVAGRYHYALIPLLIVLASGALPPTAPTERGEVFPVPEVEEI